MKPEKAQACILMLIVTAGLGLFSGCNNADKQTRLPAKTASARPSSPIESTTTIDWGNVGAVGVGNIPSDRKLTIEKARELKQPKVLFPGYLPDGAKLIMLYKWGPTLTVDLTEGDGYLPIYPLLTPGGYPLIIQVYEIDGTLFAVSASGEPKRPKYDPMGWEHPIELGRMKDHGPTRMLSLKDEYPEPKFSAISINGVPGVLGGGHTSFKQPTRFVDWWKDGTRYFVTGPNLKQEELLKIARSLNQKGQQGLRIEKPTVELRTEQDALKLFGYNPGPDMPAQTMTLNEATKLTTPEVLVPSHLPKGASFLYAFREADSPFERIVLRYDVGGFYLDITAEANKKYYSRAYDEDAPSMRVKVKGGVASVDAGAFRALDVGEHRGMAVEPEGSPTPEDRGTAPRNQQNVGVVLWDKGGETDYSIRAFGMPVAELVKVAASM